MELTQSVLHRLVAQSRKALAEGTLIPEYHEGRIDTLTFILTTYDLPEGN